MNKLLLNNNPVIVLRDFENAIKAGYRFVEGRSNLSEVSGLYELTVYKQDIEIPYISLEDALDRVTVQYYNKNEFLMEIQTYVANGWEIDLNSVVFLNLKVCKLVHPEHPASKVYSKEELNEMPWEELKAIAKIRNCFNRGKEVCVNNILKFQEERE